ncbi:MAG TPA: hypothetical protein PKD55_25295 [Bellilinea sp.]|nr:hypothetical protein [Bellilinea sp.]
MTDADWFFEQVTLPNCRKFFDTHTISDAFGAFVSAYHVGDYIILGSAKWKRVDDYNVYLRKAYPVFSRIEAVALAFKHAHINNKLVRKILINPPQKIGETIIKYLDQCEVQRARGGEYSRPIFGDINRNPDLSGAIGDPYSVEGGLLVFLDGEAYNMVELLDEALLMWRKELQAAGGQPG